MSRKTVFSSAQLPSHLNDRDRFSLWQDIHVAQIWSVEYGMSDNLPFETAIEATAVGSLVLGQMSGTIKLRRGTRAISPMTATAVISC
ncbi:hypothetical protein X734_32310 [Mesorhizobium sp. L2C084A000]|nr:hypothetical protein X734_32310 [Mesorhizobium sp. L2C084A000]